MYANAEGNSFSSPTADTDTHAAQQASAKADFLIKLHNGINAIKGIKWRLQKVRDTKASLNKWARRLLLTAGMDLAEAQTLCEDLYHGYGAKNSQASTDSTHPPPEPGTPAATAVPVPAR